EGEGDRILDLVLNREGHVDDVLVAREQERLLRHLLLPVAEAAGAAGWTRIAGPDQRVATGEGAGRGVVARRRAEADLQATYCGDRHDPMALDRPRQARVEAGPEWLPDDPAEAGPDRGLAHAHGEDTGAEVEGRRDDRTRQGSPPRGDTDAGRRPDRG